jgi:hypothetical protein
VVVAASAAKESKKDVGQKVILVANNQLVLL